MQNSGLTQFLEVNERPSFPEEEEKILAYWNEIDAFKSSYQQSVDENRPLYTFYDGPPFATGLPHYGHILAGTIKDIVTRYAHQTGYCVSRRFGWDCHGLPIECEIDKKLNIQSRKQIEQDIGIAKYNDECRSIVERYTSQWKVTMERVGRWIDFENNYKTMDVTFMESVWWAFKKLYTSGLVYRAAKVMPYSTACATPLSNFEANLNYKNVHDPSIVVVFPCREDSTMEFLAWTTTPWTLLSNCALCVNANILYTRLHRVGRTTHDGQEIDWIISKARVDWLLTQLKLKLGVDVVMKGEPFFGSKLKDMHYYPPFDFYFSPTDKVHPELFKLKTKAFRVIVDSFATDTTGTGIVHCSPAFGEDDYRVCHQNNIINKEEPSSVPCPVNDQGVLTDVVGEFKGFYIKDADKLVRESLKSKQKLLVNNEEVHSYPFCWRTDTPLIYKIFPSWFIRVESMRENLIKNNEETYWVPDTIKEKRFYNWLKDARDWCISRNRYWGTPIPLWVNEDFTQVVCIGSIEELQKYTKEPITDLHRHCIDSITIPDPRNSFSQKYPDLKRIDEVFDCWFESGCVPYGQIHYPFENEEVFRNGYPAHFVAEGLDQTRGWFYTMMVLSTALFNKAPFKNLIVNGLVLASDGKKMSKRLKNYPEPETVIKEHGADALRLYLVNSPVVKAEPLRFSDRGVRDIVREVLLPWYHAYRFLIQMITSYERETGSPFSILQVDCLANSSNIMDTWIFGSLQKLIALVHEEMKSYRLYTVVPLLIRFLDQLTNWYVRLNRDRMRAGISHNSTSNYSDTHHAINILFAVIFDTLRLMCPFTPFICELMYKNIKKLLINSSHYSPSIHFLMMPQPSMECIDDNIENIIKQMQRIIVCCRALREKKKVSLKTPLLSMTLVHLSNDGPKTLEPILHYLMEELNVLEIFIKPLDSNLIQMELIPNFKSLGTRFGSQMPLWIKKLKSVSYEDIKIFQTTHTLTVDSVQFGTDDISIKYALVSSPDQCEIVMDCIDNFVVMLDFTVNQNIHQMSIAREIVNRIQKLRKQAKLSSSSPLRMNVALSDVLVTVFTSQKDYIERSLRRPVFLVSDVAEFLRTNVVLFQECFSLNEKENIHVFFTDVKSI